MPEKKFGLAELRTATIEYLKGIPKNADTEPILNKILPLYQQNFRDREFEDLCKAIRNGTTVGSVPRPAPIHVNEVKQEPFDEKKIVNPTDAPVVESKPEPVQEVKDTTIEMKIMDLYTSCNTLEKLQAKFSKPAECKKALKDLGIESKGSFEDHLANLKLAWDNLNQ